MKKIVVIDYNELMLAFQLMINKFDKHLTSSQINERWATFLNHIKANGEIKNEDQS